MILRFLRCFAAFRDLEADLQEARTQSAIDRANAVRADGELSRVYGLYEEAYKGQTEAIKMVANVAFQVNTGCIPYRDVWHLPERKPKNVDPTPIPTGRVTPEQVLARAADEFEAQVIEFSSRYDKRA